MMASQKVMFLRRHQKMAGCQNDRQSEFLALCYGIGAYSFFTSIASWCIIELFA
jgi:hypothetical protein